MTQKVWSLAVGVLMFLAGVVLVLMTSGGVGRAAAVAGGGESTVPTVVRVAAGRMVPFKDSLGNVWEADRGFEGGATVERPELKVTGTNDPGLYCGERYSMESWSCKVPNGTYVVKLHFSECYESNVSPDDRVFTFEVQGQKVADFSPGKKAGGLYKAHVETVKDVKVTEGQIKITFTPQVKPPQINAIEVQPGGSDIAATARTKPAVDAMLKPVVRIAAGRRTPYKDTQGNTWEADKGFTGGTSIDRPDLKVKGTDEPGLYCAERYAMDSWSWEVPNGTYVLKLHFSENYDGYTAPSDRVFDFTVTDGDAAGGSEIKKVTNFSPWSKSGAQRKAFVDTTAVAVARSRITVTFTQRAGNAQINAIEVYAVEGGAVPSAPGTQGQPVAASGAAKGIIRIAAGRETPFKDSQGNIWEAERGFQGGSPLDRPELKVTGTKEPGLYCAEHYGMDSWSCKVPDGKYVLKLHFSEDYDGTPDENGRLFDYAVKDGDATTGKVVKAVKNFSPWKASGAMYKAYVDSVPIQVTKGAITVVFSPIADNPQVNAIEVIPDGAP